MGIGRFVEAVSERHDSLDEMIAACVLRSEEEVCQSFFRSALLYYLSRLDTEYRDYLGIEDHDCLDI